MYSALTNQNYLYHTIITNKLSRRTAMLFSAWVDNSKERGAQKRVSAFMYQGHSN